MKRALARLVIAGLMALLLGGCASLGKIFAPAASDAASEPTAAERAERADYEFDVASPDAGLRKLLTTYLDLARFQGAPAAEGITNAELARLMIAAPAQARTLLETEGYFNADVKVDKTTAASGKPLVRVIVEPGPRAHIAAVSVKLVGDLETAAEAGDAAAAQEREAFRLYWPLGTGKPFTQAAWSDAKNATLAQLRAHGYPAADWSSTQAKVDAAANTVQLEAVAESGPLYRLGEIRIDGLQRYDASAVTRLSTFSPGTPYSEQLLLDFQERLQKLGLFEGATVELDAHPETHDASPVLVHVRELSLQQTTTGIGYSANTGPRASLEHFHRRVFGLPWIAQNKFEYGPDLKSWTGQLTSYPQEGLYRNLIAGSGQDLRSTDEVQRSWDLRVGRTQDTPRIERLYYGEYTHATVDSTVYTTTGDAVSGNYNWIYRAIDNVLLPTRGYTLSLQGALGYARGRQTLIETGDVTRDHGPFARAYGRYTLYLPFGSSWYSTFRAEVGQVFTNAVIGVPDTLLFRAGGDDSVRGYGYRSLGPDIDGVVSSGRTLLTGSAEIARPISPRYPAYWWAMFVDAGNAANSLSNLDPAIGYGVGLRWRSPVGPLRVDLAYGQRVQQFRVHFSVGIAF